MAETSQSEFVPVAPGSLLSLELNRLGWTQREFAEVMGRPVSTINDLMLGKIRVTPELALDLEAATGKPANDWLQAEQTYRVSVLNSRAGTELIERRRRLYGRWPITEMVSRGWLSQPHGLDDLEASVQRFLGRVPLDASDEQIISALNVMTRRTATDSASLAPLFAWKRRVEYLAESRKVADFNADRVSRELPQLLERSACEQGVVEVEPWLNERGIRFVVEKHLSKTKLDGAAFWLSEKPVIAMTMRFGRLDSFWFTLCHEIAHLVLGHKEPSFDDMTTPSIDIRERQANDTAAAWLIPTIVYGEFRRRAGSRPRRDQITSFATSIRRHPGIVLGRMQHDGMTKYSSHRELLPDVRRYMT